MFFRQSSRPASMASKPLSTSQAHILEGGPFFFRLRVRKSLKYPIFSSIISLKAGACVLLHGRCIRKGPYWGLSFKEFQAC